MKGFIKASYRPLNWSVTLQQFTAFNGWFAMLFFVFMFFFFVVVCTAIHSHCKPLMAVRVHHVYIFFFLDRNVHLNWMHMQSLHCICVISSVDYQKSMVALLLDAFLQYAFFNDIDFYYCFHCCCYDFVTLFCYTIHNTSNSADVILFHVCVCVCV